MALSLWMRAVRKTASRSTDATISVARTVADSSARSMGVFLRDVSQGLLEVSHNTLALFGLVIAAVALFVAGRADLRHDAEAWTLGWLQARQESRVVPVVDPLVAELSEPDAIARATASDPKELSRQQAAVANWLSAATTWHPSRSADWSRKPGASARRPTSTRP